MPLGEMIVGALSKLLGGPLTEMYRVKREKTKRQIALRRKAVRRLETNLKLLQTLAREYEASEQYARRWSTQIRLLGDTEREVSHLLPEGWSGLFKSVRASVGVAVGGVSFADIDRRFVNSPVTPYSPEWQENCELYIGYVLDRARRWGLDPSARNAKRYLPLQFDPWLKVRRERSG